MVALVYVVRLCPIFAARPVQCDSLDKVSKRVQGRPILGTRSALLGGAITLLLGGCSILFDSAPEQLAADARLPSEADAAGETGGPDADVLDAAIPNVVREFEEPGQMVFSPPEGCDRIRVLAWGAGGAHGQSNDGAGAGGFAAALLAVETIPTITIVVGARGEGRIGGAPGGGSGGFTNGERGGGGGGYSAIFAGSTLTTSNVLVLAGGGGGGGGGGDGPSAGAGGGASGGNATATCDGQSNVGCGGTAFGGNAQLVGGLGGEGNEPGVTFLGGGGGGGGWFGGFGGSASIEDDGGGGGGGGGGGFVTSLAEQVSLVAGDGAVPGGVAHPLRGTAGQPAQNGKIVIECSSGF